MVQEILFLLFLLVMGIYWFILVLPRSVTKRYIQAFQKQGYKVYQWPFHPLKRTSWQILNQGVQRGDILHLYKKDLQGYDVLIGNFLWKPSVQLLCPDLIKEFCSLEREGFYHKNKQMIPYLQRLIGKGLLISEGQLWHKKRAALNKVFNFNFIKTLTDIMIKCCEETINQIQDKHRSENKHIIFEIEEYSIEFGSKFIFTSFLGGNLNKQRINGQNPARILQQIINQGMCEFQDICSLILGTKFIDLGIRQSDRIKNKRIKQFNDWAIDFIKNKIKEQSNRKQQYQQNYQPKDIISVLVDLPQGNSPDQFTIRKYLSEFKTFFMAGIQTTSSFFMSIIYYVYNNKNVLASLSQQIQQNIQQSTSITYQKIKKMKYLQAVQNQVIRKMGPGNGIFPRTVVKDHYIGGVKMMKGTHIEYMSISNHYSKQYFKYPSKFRPQRWINGQCSNIPAFSFVGFHGGARSCIGKQVVLLQTKIALIIFMKKFSSVKVLCNKFQADFGLVLYPKNYLIYAK